MYGLSLPTPIQIYHSTEIHGPCLDSPAPIPIPTPAPAPILALQAVTLTTLQLQWLHEDLRVTTPISPTPTYHSQAVNNHATFIEPMSPAPFYFMPSLAPMEEDDNDNTHILSPEPLPSFHPGVGWFVNHDKARDTPIIPNLILDSQTETIAPFYQYNFDMESPELLLTCGCNCCIHSCPLRAHADPYPRATLTHKQEFSFHPNQPFSKLVNHTINLEEDDTPHTEIVCYRALNTHIYSSTHHIAEMQQNLFELQKRCRDSTATLSKANTYNCLAPKVIFKDPPADFMTIKEIHNSHNTFNNPWANCPCIQMYACG